MSVPQQAEVHAASPGLEAARPDAGHSTPTFLVGSVRSGTTLLRLMLDHHPHVAFAAEFDFVVTPLPAAGGFIGVEQFRQFAEHHRVFRASGFRVRDGLADFPAVARDFLEQLRRRSGGKPLVGATVHLDFDRLPRIWPDAKYIHIVRDPRDVSRSIVEMGWSGNAWAGARRWAAAERLWDRFAPSIPAERKIEITHEGLVADPVGTLTRLAEFMGTGYDPAMLSYPDDTTYGPPTPSLVEQWKRKLSRRDVRIVEAVVGELLTSRGYAPSGLPPAKLTRWFERQLLIESKFGKQTFNLRRYGPLLWSADLLTRRLRLGTLEKKVRRRMDEIDSKRLK